jgi:hypothetical protein
MERSPYVWQIPSGTPCTCMYVHIPSIQQSASLSINETVNVVMRNSVFFSNLALLIKPEALHQQSQDFHKTETHCFNILFMYTLTAASVMNRKQGRKEGLRPTTRGLMFQHDLHCLMLMRTTHRLTPSLRENKNYYPAVFFFISRTTKITTLRNRVNKS